MSPVLQRTGGVLNRSPRGAPHESLSAEGDKASPLVRTADAADFLSF